MLLRAQAIDKAARKLLTEARDGCREPGPAGLAERRSRPAPPARNPAQLAAKTRPVAVDTTVDRVAAAEFDALVIPGGYAPDKLRRSEAVLALVRAFDDAGKPIAFICHAGWVPISAKILNGRRATSVAAIRDDMVNAGVDWVDQATVVDGNLISARTPADLGPWMKALLAALEKTGN